MKNLIRNILRESEFDWTDESKPSPNYQGHPQGVVYLRTHDEIDEFFGLLGKNGYLSEGNIDDYHETLEMVRDKFESDEWDGYDDWVPTITVSFFISKKDPTKYDTGHWDYDVQEDSVQHWLDDHGCKQEVIDCENWKIYTDISQVRSLLDERLVESNDFEWTEEADVTWSTYYNEIFRDVLRFPDNIEDVNMDTIMSVYHKLDVLTREVRGGSSLKDTSTFDEIYRNMKHIIKNIHEDMDQKLYTRMKNYILGDIQEVTNHLKRVNESNEFEWTEYSPIPGKNNQYDLYELVTDKRLRIGHKIRLVGYAGDINRSFDHEGTISDVFEINTRYQGDDNYRYDDNEYGFTVLINDFDGYGVYEYEVNNTFADQQELTFDIIDEE